MSWLKIACHNDLFFFLLFFTFWVYKKGNLCLWILLLSLVSYSCLIFFRNLWQFFLFILTKFNHVSHKESFYVPIVSQIYNYFYQSIISHNLSLSINTVSIEIHPIFTLRDMRSVASENSPSGNFFN